MNNHELTLLSEGQIWGNDKEYPLEVIKKYGTKAAVTDLCILTGSYLRNDTDFDLIEDSSLKRRRASHYWTRSDNFADVCLVNGNGNEVYSSSIWRSNAVRPVLQSSVIFSQISMNRVKGYNGTEEVEYGEYPQYAADSRMQSILESEYNKGMNKTGRNYTFDSLKDADYDTGFKPVTYEEYEYQEKKYIRIIANSNFGGDKFKLSNGVLYRDGDYVWVEVSPVKWLIDDKTEMLVSKVGLVSGIRFLGRNHKYKGDFSRTEMKEYLDRYMSKDLFQAPIKEKRKNTIEEKRKNPFGFTFDKVSEEETVHGAIESNIPVFLHGKPGEGKSARIKQIDSNCEVLSLGTLTPELLVGMALKDTDEKKVEYMAPPWYDRLVKKCQSEPDKIHILFLDELNNASPNMQKYAFSIALDRKVNDRFLLPDNVRIAAAGNEVEDSLTAYELAGPLYDRFTHVNIKTTPEQWLKWASVNNIHPAVYTYIAYGGDRVLRTESKGDKQTPTADPRKWEMASKMLYATKNPEMLRGIVGEDITREFTEFCMQPVITVEDVLNPTFDENQLKDLNVAEAYATVMSLSYVDEENAETIINAISNMGPEFVNTFYSIWAHGDSERLQKVAELQMTSIMQEGGHRR